MQSVCAGQVPRIDSGHIAGNVRWSIHPSTPAELANRLELSFRDDGCTCSRKREAGLVRDLVGTLLAHAEDLGNLDKAQRGGINTKHRTCQRRP